MRSHSLPMADGPDQSPAQRLASALDASVNVVDPRGFESRYVRRSAERAVLYLSPQTGCAQGCSMCWLTALGLKTAQDADLTDLLEQLTRGLRELDAATSAGTEPPSELHADFMARGDALASRALPEALPRFARALRIAAANRGAAPRIILSTILPRVGRGTSLNALAAAAEGEGVRLDVYWSWYSSSPEFRARRMPAADDPARGFDRMQALSLAQGRPARIHFALIPGENDSLGDAGELRAALEARWLAARVNLVAYNPPPGEPPAEIGPEEAEARAVAYAAELAAGPTIEAVKRIVPVGPDVAASCGMFVGGAP